MRVVNEHLGRLLGVAFAAGLALALGLAPIAEAGGAERERTGEELYLSACAACHGADGRGAPQALVGFDTPLPDFTDCSFATREPDSDWVAVTHDGGPARGFSQLMPAFGEALSRAGVERVVGHVRTFCPEDDWPRGDLNFPRAMFTEKAFVEDEVVFTVGGPVEGAASVTGRLVYETRFGEQNAIEVVVPLGFRELSGGESVAPSAGGWTGGVGNVAFGVKRAFVHSLRTGSILSATGEVILPTGNRSLGFGKGTTVFEPFVTYGQDLFAVGFLQFQGGVELPLDTALAEREGFWRLALGRSFTQGAFGRTWSPMVELLGSRALESGAPTQWDLVPQFQVTLNQRQHVMANLAVRIPLQDGTDRPTEVYAYLLWDWFDGGFFEGW